MDDLVVSLLDMDRSDWDGLLVPHDRGDDDRVHRRSHASASRPPVDVADRGDCCAHAVMARSIHSSMCIVPSVAASSSGQDDHEN